jgi:hypothetical protein
MEMIRKFRKNKKRLGDWKTPTDEVKAGRRLRLEPGVAREFDLPPEMAARVQAQINLDQLAAELQGRDPEGARKVFDNFGSRWMQAVVAAGDGEFKDRTGEMVELIARQTGLRFPHVFSRYLELSLLSLRPLDKWNVVRSTARELIFEEYSCAIFEKLKSAGMDLRGTPCSAVCFARFAQAMRKAEIGCAMFHLKRMAADGLCVFQFQSR